MELVPSGARNPAPILLQLRLATAGAPRNDKRADVERKSSFVKEKFSLPGGRELEGGGILVLAHFLLLYLAPLATGAEVAAAVSDGKALDGCAADGAGLAATVSDTEVEVGGA